MNFIKILKEYQNEEESDNQEEQDDDANAVGDERQKEGLLDDKTEETLQIIDNFMAGINFSIVFELEYLSVEVTGNKELDKFGNKKLITFGCENQKYEVVKQDQDINLKICGWKFGYHDKLQ